MIRWLLIPALLCYFSIHSQLEGCTRLFWNDNALAKIVARTMDLFTSDEPQMWVNPRGISRESTIAENGLKWISQYGSVSISALHMKDFIIDGLNEEGLAVHALALSATKYEPRDSRPALHYGEWLQYLLDTCQNVEQALKAHQNFQVVATSVRNFVWPIHLMIEDASGDSAIVEFVEGQMKIYHGSHYQVATNDPPYEVHLKNLENYKRFGGGRSLPKKSDSFSRFIRASAYLKHMQEPKTREEAIGVTKEVITQLFQKNNLLKNNDLNFFGSDLRVSTLWTTILDLTHRSYYFFQTGKPNGIALHFSELDFSENAPTLVVNLCDDTLFAEK